MDLVYICRDGDNEELRYSIRSAVANIPHDNIWVFGGKPDWYIGNHVRLKQIGLKYDNARSNLASITRHYDVSDDFILMNDDFFAIRPVEKVENYHRGTLSEHIELIKTSNGYRALVQETYDVLTYLGYEDPLSYELHIPMIMNKEKLAKVIRTVGLWRSNYGNMYNVGGERRDDVKVHNHVSLDIVINSPLPYISTFEDTFQGVLDSYLRDAFPEPSKYEKSPQ
jgi:hypothetical protein